MLWELTHGCNLKCVMCYNDRLAEPELSTSECFEILGQLAAADTLRLTLSGGEILTRPDFFEIACEARRLGFALDLKTNGVLVSARAADKIAALSPVRWTSAFLAQPLGRSPSLPGSGAHCLPCCAWPALKGSRGAGQAQHAPDERERRRSSGMLDLAESLGVEYEQVLKISPSDGGAAQGAERQLSQAEMTAALVADGAPFAQRTVAPGARTCAVGLSSCLISPYGIVYPCVELRIPAGDLRRQSFAAIWREARIFRELRDGHIVSNLAECRECALLPHCEGRCAGISWKETGDPFRGHTLACLHARARFEQQYPGTPAPHTPFIARQREAARQLGHGERGGEKMISTSQNQTLSDVCQPWEEPQIILERLLLVSAQQGPTGGPPQPGFLGPLGTSGNQGICGLPQ